jgi:hypothetical protein|tara:strand:+ start:180 stop:539 length:360 start_codon:yes stop_codon:yes gene_type:complete
MRQSIYIELGDKKIGVVRNPYERVVNLYRESWNWCGFEKWLAKAEILSQTEVYRDCIFVVTLESWESDFKALGITPDKKSMELLYKKYSSDYRRWYDTSLKDMITPIAQTDLDTYGYRF